MIQAFEDIQKLQKDYNDIKRLYDSKLNELLKKIENHFVENINKTPKDKIDLFAYNVDMLYSNNEFDVMQYSKYSSGIDWGSLFGNSTRIELYSDKDLLKIAFSQIFLQDKFKTANKPIYSYNKVTKEILPFTNESWAIHRRTDEFDLLKDFVSICSGNAIKQPEQNDIKLRECTDWKITIGSHNEQITPELLIYAIERIFRLKKEVHILHANLSIAKQGKALTVKAGTIEYTDEELQKLREENTSK